MPIRTVRRSLVPQPRVRLLKARRFSPPPPPATHEQNGGVSGDDTARPPPRQQRGKARASRVAQISLPVALTTTSLDANRKRDLRLEVRLLVGRRDRGNGGRLDGPGERGGRRDCDHHRHVWIAFRHRYGHRGGALVADQRRKRSRPQEPTWSIPNDSGRRTDNANGR